MTPKDYMKEFMTSKDHMPDFILQWKQFKFSIDTIDTIENEYGEITLAKVSKIIKNTIMPAFAVEVSMIVQWQENDAMTIEEILPRPKPTLIAPSIPSNINIDSFLEMNVGSKAMEMPFLSYIASSAGLNVFWEPELNMYDHSWPMQDGLDDQTTSSDRECMTYPWVFFSRSRKNTIRVKGKLLASHEGHDIFNTKAGNYIVKKNINAVEADAFYVTNAEDLLHLPILPGVMSKFKNIIFENGRKP